MIGSQYWLVRHQYLEKISRKMSAVPIATKSPPPPPPLKNYTVFQVNMSYYDDQTVVRLQAREPWLLLQTSKCRAQENHVFCYGRRVSLGHQTPYCHCNIGMHSILWWMMSHIFSISECKNNINKRNISTFLQSNSARRGFSGSLIHTIKDVIMEVGGLWSIWPVTTNVISILMGTIS